MDVGVALMLAAGSNDSFAATDDGLNLFITS